jgi:hypothetical protein
MTGVAASSTGERRTYLHVRRSRIAYRVSACQAGKKINKSRAIGRYRGSTNGKFGGSGEFGTSSLQPFRLDSQEIGGLCSYSRRSGQQIRFPPFMPVVFPLLLFPIAISSVYVYFRFSQQPGMAGICKVQ